MGREELTEKWGTGKWDSGLFFCHASFCRQAVRPVSLRAVTEFREGDEPWNTRNTRKVRTQSHLGGTLGRGACGEIAGRRRVMLVFHSYSARILLVFRSCSPCVSPLESQAGCGSIRVAPASSGVGLTGMERLVFRGCGGVVI